MVLIRLVFQPQNEAYGTDSQSSVAFSDLKVPRHETLSEEKSKGDASVTNLVT